MHRQGSEGSEGPRDRLCGPAVVRPGANPASSLCLGFPICKKGGAVPGLLLPLSFDRWGD